MCDRAGSITTLWKPVEDCSWPTPEQLIQQTRSEKRPIVRDKPPISQAPFVVILAPQRAAQMPTVSLFGTWG